jgi:tellurite resistance protein TerC
MEQQLLLWGGFLLFVAAMLGLDLGVFHRKAHVVQMREAVGWTAVWITLALLFNAGIAYFWGAQAGVEFLTGYLVEKSLSMDNVFVFLLIFNYFNTPPAYQHKVLFWGILGAIVFRSIFIVAGLAVLEMFHWSMYVFGSFLLGTGVWMMVKKGEQYDPERNPVIRLFRRYFPIADRYEADHFFVRKHGAWLATPLFVVLLAIESSDIVFAVDSIPAIFAITQDHFIVYTSNVFAMLGLRAMYFAVASFMRSFHYLHYGFASIIVILGIKMLLSDVYLVPVTLSLVLIVLILMASMIVSLLRPRAEDLKRILQRSQRLGVLSFRRLLLLENVFQLEKLRVREAMRPRARVHVLRADARWEANRRLMVETRLSRYPVVDTTDRPLGIVPSMSRPSADLHAGQSTFRGACRSPLDCECSTKPPRIVSGRRGSTATAQGDRAGTRLRPSRRLPRRQRYRTRSVRARVPRPSPCAGHPVPEDSPPACRQ